MKENKGFFDYERPSVATDVVLMRMKNIFSGKRSEDKKKFQVLLYKRNSEPDNNKWSLPGGFVGINEKIEETAINKVKEKTGYDNIYLEQLYTFDAPNRDNRWRIISVSHIGITNNQNDCFSDNGFKNEWFDIEGDMLISQSGISISLKDLAFDHGEIIQKAIERMRGKLFYSDIAFYFLKDNFTIRELQSVFEKIAGKKINNFYRTIKPKVVETGQIYQGKACRPAKLFKKK